MKPTLEDAIIFAAQKHRGQIDKAGAPYILHPLRVMASLGREAGETERIAAILHDVVEDCEVSLENLREMGFSDEAVEAIDARAKREDEKDDYMKAIRRAAQNAVARRVKIGDLGDNMDLSRLPNPTENDRARLEKYRAARQFLSEYLEDAASSVGESRF
ncbi:HD domain-containing protein [Abditibacterium utsteinense]|uniref:HD domain-containing protein n=1 Tax=Abditibacterium utsteinense TaxID=1960156 RepID=A0A2S8SP52_9BACT|nr:HD domain-containing protein [Abditibacterium utsteinense]PQV62573.1 HD domain-containing protein [Abditibacterium utsteinense]